MNIENGLEEKIRPISANNCLTLSLEERLKLETLLDQLKSDIKSDEMLFWGKIMGAEKDYYIAEALYYKNHNIFPKKKFYFCNNATFVFSELPDIQEHHLNDFSKFNSYFVGNPDIILAKYEDNTPLNSDLQISNGDTFKEIRKIADDKYIGIIEEGIKMDNNPSGENMTLYQELTDALSQTGNLTIAYNSESLNGQNVNKIPKFKLEDIINRI